MFTFHLPHQGFHLTKLLKGERPVAVELVGWLLQPRASFHLNSECGNQKCWPNTAQNISQFKTDTQQTNTNTNTIWQLLSIKENICPERPRKSHALQDAKKYFFLYITRKMRSTAFQPCITLGGLHWDEMGQKHDFLKKNALKTAFLGDTILDRLTSEGLGSPKKIKNATFLMLSFNDGP